MNYFFVLRTPLYSLRPRNSFIFGDCVGAIADSSRVGYFAAFKRRSSSRVWFKLAKIPIAGVSKDYKRGLPKMQINEN